MLVFLVSSIVQFVSLDDDRVYARSHAANMVYVPQWRDRTSTSRISPRFTKTNISAGTDLIWRQEKTTSNREELS